MSHKIREISGIGLRNWPTPHQRPCYLCEDSIAPHKGPGYYIDVVFGDEHSIEGEGISLNEICLPCVELHAPSVVSRTTGD